MIWFDFFVSSGMSSDDFDSGFYKDPNPCLLFCIIDLLLCFFSLHEFVCYNASHEKDKMCCFFCLLVYYFFNVTFYKSFYKSAAYMIRLKYDKYFSHYVFKPEKVLLWVVLQKIKYFFMLINLFLVFISISLILKDSNSMSRIMFSLKILH